MSTSSFADGRRRLGRWLGVACLGLAAAATHATQAAQTTPSGAGAQGEVWSALRDGAVLLYRHAQAPGIGDPPQFRLGDCSTQRNLDDTGRAQARAIGRALRERGVSVGAVWASPWCRTRETAALAFPGRQIVDQPAFQSFFNQPELSPAQTRDALALLQAWRGPGVLVVVTHQVNISALTGGFATSGEGVAMRWQDGRWVVLGRVAPP